MIHNINIVLRNETSFGTVMSVLNAFAFNAHTLNSTCGEASAAGGAGGAASAVGIYVTRSIIEAQVNYSKFTSS